MKIRIKKGNVLAYLVNKVFRWLINTNQLSAKCINSSQFIDDATPGGAQYITGTNIYQKNLTFKTFLKT